MFKKSKPKVAPPPPAPTVEQMLADVETFEVIHSAEITSISSEAVEQALLTEPENLTLESWWKVFDEYDQKVMKLAILEGALETQREKLLACKLNLEKQANDLRDSITKQQTLIKEVVDD